MDGPTRRAVLEGTGVVVAAGVVGFVGFQAAAPAVGTGPVGYPGSTNDQGRDDHAGGSGPGSAGALAELSDVPDGGGLVVTDEKVVLTRDGSTVHAFTAVCTHQGCLVREVRGGEIHCPCHGSTFDATTGVVVQGPATRALEAVDVVVRDEKVIRT
ncbi:Rieske (2Fe-2S) protein [Cellulomonas sp. URHD0024]|uniref:Rieske (2Fe-2S) protein n=1 Tax=Cellulomonas sp. URHD0024 TaxID=1302620 RepID=UPI0003FB0896|nr:Rieske (2Fe-2S) protein [Cellulomonas sp. URHD0024]